MGRTNTAGAIAANAVYVNNHLTAENCSGTLPEGTNQTVTVNMGGETDLPVTGLFNAMELSISKNGFDKDMAYLLMQERVNVEVRAAQDIVAPDGTKKVIQIKAFLGCCSMGIPSFGMEIGSVSENEYTLQVLRYELIVDGKQILLIDKPNQIRKINGKDYAQDITSLL